MFHLKHTSQAAYTEIQKIFEKVQKNEKRPNLNDAECTGADLGLCYFQLKL